MQLAGKWTSSQDVYYSKLKALTCSLSQRLLLPLQGRRSKMLAAITASMMQEKLKLEGPVADNHIEQPDPSSDGDTSDDDDVELQSLTGSDADAEPLQKPAIKQEKPEVSL
jgi:hypothetical protein